MSRKSFLGFTFLGSFYLNAKYEWNDFSENKTHITRLVYSFILWIHVYWTPAIHEVLLFYSRDFWHTVDPDMVPALKGISFFSQKDRHILNQWQCRYELITNTDSILWDTYEKLSDLWLHKEILILVHF